MVNLLLLVFGSMGIAIVGVLTIVGFVFFLNSVFGNQISKILLRFFFSKKYEKQLQELFKEAPLQTLIEKINEYKLSNLKNFVLQNYIRRHYYGEKNKT